ncbi:unnamed protein product [Rotaria magnacalcarata]|uniref:Uncharacterized protein n=1 Tax=Rotaria magnacalcarata TaxID=392030 RepID=A0A816NTW1_9BILA|nr:unnamed protein product [Rotaria magnacalcarata]
MFLTINNNEIQLDKQIILDIDYYVKKDIEKFVFDNAAQFNHAFNTLINTAKTTIDNLTDSNVMMISHSGMQIDSGMMFGMNDPPPLEYVNGPMTLGIHGQFEFGTGNSYQQLCPRQSQAQADRNKIQMKHLENNDPYMRGQPPPYSNMNVHDHMLSSPNTMSRHIDPCYNSWNLPFSSHSMNQNEMMTSLVVENIDPLLGPSPGHEQHFMNSSPAMTHRSEQSMLHHRLYNNTRMHSSSHYTLRLNEGRRPSPSPQSNFAAQLDELQVNLQQQPDCQQQSFLRDPAFLSILNYLKTPPANLNVNDGQR